MSSAEPWNSGPAAIQSGLSSNALRSWAVNSLSLVSALMNRYSVLAGASSRSLSLAAFALFLFGRGVAALDGFPDLLHEFLKAHGQHFRTVEQSLVPMRDGLEVEVGAAPLQDRGAGAPWRRRTGTVRSSWARLRRHPSGQAAGSSGTDRATARTCLPSRDPPSRPRRMQRRPADSRRPAAPWRRTAGDRHGPVRARHRGRWWSGRAGWSRR